VVDPDEPPHPDRILPLFPPEHGEQADVADEIQLGKVAQLALGQALLGAEEAVVERRLGELLETGQDDRLVVGPDGPDDDGSAVPQAGFAPVGAERRVGRVGQVRRAAYLLRSLATLGAMTAAQYGWLGFRS
jgi:hypothetical protein